MGYGLGRESIENTVIIRTVVLASADAHFRARLRQQLAAMRWQVREAAGGAEAMAQLEAQGAEAMVLDTVLPDLEVGEFARQMRSRHPVMELLQVDAGADEVGARSPRRNELLHAMRQAQQDVGGSASEIALVELHQSSVAKRFTPTVERARVALEVTPLPRSRSTALSTMTGYPSSTQQEAKGVLRPRIAPLPEMVGESPDMLELARMVRLVAPRSTTVLIEGDTGTGKELVATAVHRLALARAKRSWC